MKTESYGNQHKQREIQKVQVNELNAHGGLESTGVETLQGRKS